MFFGGLEKQYTNYSPKIENNATILISNSFFLLKKYFEINSVCFYYLFSSRLSEIVGENMLKNVSSLLTCSKSDDLRRKLFLFIIL